MQRCLNFNQLSVSERGWIVEFRFGKLAVSNDLNIKQREICRKGTCAIRKTTDHKERLSRINALRGQFSTSMSVSQEWLTIIGQRLFLLSINHRIRSFGLQSGLILPLTQLPKYVGRWVISSIENVCRRRGGMKENQFCLEWETALSREEPCLRKFRNVFT